MNYQDWEPVVIYKNKNDKNDKNNNNNNKVQNYSGTNVLKKLENDEISSLPKIDFNISKELIKKRNLVNITQKELAQALNLPINIITELENGKSGINKGLVNKINKYLDKLSKTIG